MVENMRRTIFLTIKRPGVDSRSFGRANILFLLSRGAGHQSECSGLLDRGRGLGWEDQTRQSSVGRME